MPGDGIPGLGINLTPILISMKKLLALSAALVAVFAYLPVEAVAGPRHCGGHQTMRYSYRYTHVPVRHYAPPVRYVSRGYHQNYRYVQPPQQCHPNVYRPTYYRPTYYPPVYHSYRGYSRPGVTIHFGGGGYYRRW